MMRDLAVLQLAPFILALRSQAVRWRAIAATAWIAGCGVESSDTLRLMVTSPQDIETARFAADQEDVGVAIHLGPDAHAIRAVCEGRIDVAWVGRRPLEREVARCLTPPHVVPLVGAPRSLAVWAAARSETWLTEFDDDELFRLLAAPAHGGAETWAEVREGLPSVAACLVAPAPWNRAYAELMALLPPGLPLRGDILAAPSASGTQTWQSGASGCLRVGYLDASSADRARDTVAHGPSTRENAPPKWRRDLDQPAHSFLVAPIAQNFDWLRRALNE